MKNLFFTLLLFASVFLIGFGLYNHIDNNLNFDYSVEVSEEDLKDYETYGIGENTTEETRISMANVLVNSLNENETLPEDFDTQLFNEWENKTTYFKFFNVAYGADKTNVFPSVLFKAYKDEELTKPIYIYEKLISEQNTFGFVPQETYISYVNTQGNIAFSLISDKEYLERFYKNTNFYFKNSENEVFKFQFKEVKYWHQLSSWVYRPASLLNNSGILNKYNSVLDFEEVGEVFANYQIDNFIDAETLAGGGIIGRIPAKLNFVGLAEVYANQTYIRAEHYYQLFKIASPQSYLSVYSNDISKILNYKAYLSYSRYEYNSTSNLIYPFEPLILGAVYNNYCSFNVEQTDRIVLSTLLPSIYYKNTYQAQNLENYLIESDLNINFSFEVESSQVKILTLPGAVYEYFEGSDNVFKLSVKQFDIDGNLLDSSLTSQFEIDKTNYLKYFAYTQNAECLSILFDNDFALNANAEYMQIQFIALGNSSAEFQEIINGIYAVNKI